MRTKMNYVGRLSLLLGLMSALAGQVSGQVVDSSFSKEFNAFKKQINQEYQAFSHQNDSIFILFLMNSWKEFEGRENPVPVLPKPVEQPKIQNPVTNEVPQDTVTPEIINDPEIPPGQENNVPQKDALGNLSLSKSFSFYGSRIELPLLTSSMPSLSSVSRKGIVDFFTKASQSAYLNEIVLSLKEKSGKVKLNDWGFASLVFQASGTYYSNINEQLLFAWVTLLHSGYNVKVGYSNHRIYLLIPADVQLYTMSYTIGNREYYVLGPGSVPTESEQVYIHEADYPGNKSDFSFKLTEVPRFGYLETQRTMYFDKTIHLNLNKNLLEFYQHYPPCDLEVYFNTPVSANVMQSLDAFFLPLMDGKNDTERIDLLLDFVQRAIRYKTDREQFGKERYLFPDETLFYPAADCEDRSVLFARLIRRCTKLDAIGLCYPLHVSVAVNLPSCQKPDYIMFSNKRFYHCDPTYLGAKCGMAMPSVRSATPEIVDYMRL